MARIPTVGDRLTSEDVEELYEAIIQRQANFPGEPMVMAMNWVFMNYGSRYTPVTCVGPERWASFAMDVVRTDGNPTCPSGHEVEKVGPPLRLFWLTEDVEVSLERREEVSDGS